MNNETKLKPCPFCGSENITLTQYSREAFETLENDWYVCAECQNCESTGAKVDFIYPDDLPSKNNWNTEETQEAIKLWNQRATRITEVTENDIEKIKSSKAVIFIEE